MAAVLEILKQIGKTLILSFFTEQYIKELIVAGLEYLSKKTSNEIDDKVVEAIKKALYPQPEPKQE